MLIRKIEKPDNELIAQIIRAVMTEFGAVGPGYSIEDPEVDSMFETYSVPSSIYYILEEEKRVIGGGGIAPLAGSAAKDATCELKKMYFLDEARGKGYGKLLGEMLLVDAARKGYRRVYIETLETMSVATNSIRRWDFVEASSLATRGTVAAMSTTRRNCGLPKSTPAFLARVRNWSQCDEFAAVAVVVRPFAILFCVLTSAISRG